MRLCVIGNSSEHLKRLMHLAGYDDWFQYPLELPHSPSMEDIRGVRERFLRLVKLRHNETVLGLGSTAIKLFQDKGSDATVAKHRGRPITIEGTKLKGYVTYDPASIDKNTENERLILEDLKRFKLPLLKWPADKFPSGKLVGMDTEFAPDGKCLDVAISDLSSSIRIGPTDVRNLKRLFAIPELVGHSVAGDLTQLITLGCKREDWCKGENIHDTFITVRLLDENRGRGNYTVDAVLLGRKNVKGWKHKTDGYSRTDATQWPVELRAERCRLDAWASKVVYDDWNTDDTLHLAQRLHTRISMTMERIKLAGAYVDLNAYETWSKEVNREHARQLAVVTQIAWKRGMKEFSPTKPKDVRDLFYKKMRMPVVDRTKTGLPAVTKSFLYRNKDTVPEVAEILKFRKLDKLLTTYVTGIKEKFQYDKEGKAFIPFRLGTMGTRTGRRASDKPNAQNWPKSARAIITSRWEKGQILSNDFSKLEIILLAYEAQDEELLRYFTSETNGYISIGSKLFGKTVEEGTKEYTQTKSVILGVNYNLQTFGLAKQLWDLHGVRLSSTYELHVEKVDEIRKRYLRMFPKISAFQRERVNEVHKYGSVLCWFGQLRRLPIPPQPARSEGKEAFKVWRKHTAHLENEAINARIQNAASFVTGLAASDVETAFLEHYGLTHVSYHRALAENRLQDLRIPALINEVHDDLVVDCPNKEVRTAQRILKDCMENSRTLRKLMPDFDAPLKVGQTANNHWGVK